jgi:pimeloyl-ACP methyl ester carboxylesterase
VSRGLRPVTSWRVAVAAIALSACAWLAAPAQCQPRGGEHLYVLLGFANLSPGLSDFGSRIGHRGIPTTVGSYMEWPAFAAEAVERYKHGHLRAIMIVGHSLGGAAAHAMAAELGRHGVPVRLVVTLDPVGDSEKSKNVRRSVTILPKADENHFSMIAAHDRELRRYVLGGKSPPRAHNKRAPRAHKRSRHHAQARPGDRFNAAD